MRVAPPVGARVEIGTPFPPFRASCRRPSRGGASRNYIELIKILSHAAVAPPVGARVEMLIVLFVSAKTVRRPSRGGASRNLGWQPHSYFHPGSPLPWGRE